jgi:benzil reductase ((S)-benzoin forming)
MKAIIITGVSRGLGKAFFDILKDKDYYLICISRSFIDYQTKLAESDNIELIRFDLNDINNLTLKLNSATILKKCDFDELIFINNAGVISPIGKVGNIDEKDIKKSININFVSPVLITNYLSAFCSKNKIKFKILNISTGAADKPFEGWSIYCSTKSAAKMFFNVIEKEKDVVVENIDPGVLNTLMQKEIRNANKSNFPLVDYFKNLEKESELKEPSQVALNILKSNDLI